MNLLHVGTGTLCSGILLAIAQERRFFAKRGLEVRPVFVSGTDIPDLSQENPAALIGAPAALLGAAAGTPLKILGAINTARAVGQLVARRGIENPDELRGKRFGVRAIGAGQWIQTMLALKALALNQQEDSISIVAIGDQRALALALETERIDAAIVYPTHSTTLSAKGCSVLLDLYDADIQAFPEVLAVHASLLEHPVDQVRQLVTGLAETMVFSLRPENKQSVLANIAQAFNLSDPAALAAGYEAFLRTAISSPSSCVHELRNMQQVMTLHDPNILRVQVEAIVDEDVARGLEANRVLSHF